MRRITALRVGEEFSPAAQPVAKSSVEEHFLSKTGQTDQNLKQQLKRKCTYMVSLEELAEGFHLTVYV